MSFPARKPSLLLLLLLLLLGGAAAATHEIERADENYRDHNQDDI